MADDNVIVGDIEEVFTNDEDVVNDLEETNVIEEPEDNPEIPEEDKDFGEGGDTSEETIVDDDIIEPDEEDIINTVEENDLTEYPIAVDEEKVEPIITNVETLPTIGNIKNGDKVMIALVNGEPTILGSVGSGDRQQTEINNLSNNLLNVSQYFWHNNQDSGAGEGAGAHITEIPMEDFIADPSNGGGNTLIISTGIRIRDGITNLATFSSSEGVQIGQRANLKSRLRLSDNALQIVYHANDSDYVVGEFSTRGLVLDGHDSSIGATEYKEESFMLPHNSQTNGTTATRLKLGMGVWIITAWAQFDESSTGRRWLAIRDLTYGYTEQEVNQMAVNKAPTRMMTTFIAEVGTDGTNDSITYCPRVYQNSGLSLLTELKICAVRIV